MLRSWQLMAALAVIGFAVAAFAAVAEASSGPDAPMAGDGFGEVPGAAARAPDRPEAVSGPATPAPQAVPRPALWDVFDHDAGGVDDLGPLRDHAPVGGPSSASVAAADQPGEGGGPAGGDGASAEVVPRPIGIRIPALAVDAPTIPLGLQANREIEVPEVRGETGWWRGGPSPGQPGPAVILGHVNTWEGPDVFNGLHALGPGEEVFVDLEDGTTVVYAVQAAALYLKDDFPTEAVYLEPSDTSLLRLVTCGGTLDRSNGSYDSNYIVFAEQTRTEGPDHRLDRLR